MPPCSWATPGKKPGHILEGDERNIEGIAEADKAGALVRGVDIQRPGQVVGLVGDDADGLSGQAAEPDDDVPGILGLDFKEVVVVQDLPDDACGCRTADRAPSGTMVLSSSLVRSSGSFVAFSGGSSMLLLGMKDSSSRMRARACSSFSAAKWATPLRALCVSAPPSSSMLTSSCVTALITSGPVMNMLLVSLVMMMKSVMAGE